ncbi:MAG: hypothetical protein M1495_02065 [Bacteroidetes bacterium]|nr:hypothetical protein [Bacteroidota bacterium]
MELIVNWIRDNTAWLYTRIYQSSLFFFDYWSLVHIYSSIGLFILFTFWGIKRRWLLLSLILVSYEVIEIVLVFLALHLFKPETFKDQFTDIVVGYLGGFIGQYLLKEKKMFNLHLLHLPLYVHIVACYSAFTVAFVWVGNYQYHYNQPFFNSPGLNWWAFVLWFVGLIAHNEFYFFFKRSIKNIYVRLFVSWLWFFAGLLAFEFVGYYVLNIRNISYGGNPALIFGLIHGTKVLYVFYLSAALVSIAIFEIFHKIFFVASQKELVRIRDSEKQFA